MTDPIKLAEEIELKGEYADDGGTQRLPPGSFRLIAAALRLAEACLLIARDFDCCLVCGESRVTIVHRPGCALGEYLKARA